MNKTLITALSLFLIFFLTSCDVFSQKAGTFSVKFSWEKDGEGNEIKPDIANGEFFVTVRIYEWAQGVNFPGDIGAHGRQLLQSEPVKMLEKGTKIEFGDLSYGDRRFITAEIRRGKDLTGGILFTGMSQLFDFKVGKHTEVNVEMSLTSTPGVDEEGNRIDAELRIVDESGNLRGYTNGDDLEVNLRLINAVSFTRVFIANKEELLKTDKGKEYQKPALAELEEKNSYEINEKWDLSFGLTEDEMAVLPELKVYARVENEYGQGLLLMARIALDNEPPELILAINPTYTNGSQPITLGISANELIRYDTLNLQTTNPKLEFNCPTPTRNESLSFSCTIETLDSSIADGEYEITVTASDQAGNISEETRTTLTIDREEPDLTFTVYKNGEEAEGLIYLKEDDEFEVNLVLSKEPSATPVVRLGSSSLDCRETEDLKYSCSTTIKPSTYPEGISDLSVAYQDMAGNQFNKTIVSGIRLDYTPPEIVGEVAVHIIKPVGCPLSSVSAVTSGSSIEITFTVSEILGEEGIPSVRGISGENIIDFSFTGQVGYLYLFKVDNIVSPAQGIYDLEIEMTDVAGNYRKVVKPGAFVIKTSSLASPSVKIPHNIVYRRVPWGSKETDGIRYYSIKAKEGVSVVDERAVEIIVYDGPDKFIASEIGRTSVFEGTFSEFELNRSDRSEVFIAVYDDACNSSETVKVLDVEWTATMGGKVRGRNLENPHRFTTTPIFYSSFVQNESINIEPSNENLNKLKHPDNNSVLRKTEAQWREVNIGNKPSPRIFHSMTYLPSRNKVVLFGGYKLDTGNFSNETWEWDVETGIWRDRTPITISPSPRYWASMTTDLSAGKVLLFGGVDQNNTYKNDFWEWDSFAGTWIQHTFDGTEPEKRVGSSMIYDPYRNKVILSGGLTYDDVTVELKSDVWEFDRKSITWSKVIPGNDIFLPVGRYLHSMVYCQSCNSVIMFGGSTDYNEPEPINDMWMWDGKNWAEIDVEGVEIPLQTLGSSIVYDRLKNQIIFHGSAGDVWEFEFTGSTTGKWSKVQNEGIKPSERFTTNAMAYDGKRNLAIVFGDSEGKDDIWQYELDSERWIERTVRDEKPSIRREHAMVYDSSRNRTVLFGGSDSENAHLNDLWEWDGINWAHIEPEGNKPLGRRGHRLVFDESINKTVLFGGYSSQTQFCNETWEWDGINWTQRTGDICSGTECSLCGTETVCPPGRYFHAMTYDNLNERIVLFGGERGGLSFLNDSWEWNGNQWEIIDDGNYPNRDGHSMTYDVIDQTVVLFGGREFDEDQNKTHFTNDLWVLDEDLWITVSPISERPSPRHRSSMVWDDSRKKILLFGGNSGAQNGETWEWNGKKSKWKRMFVTGAAPSARYSHEMVYDNVRERVLLFGGAGIGSDSNDTWEWGFANNRAAQIMTTFFSASEEDPETAEITSVSILFFAGGTGYPAPACTQQNGTEMFVWNSEYKGGAWMKAGKNLAGSDSVDKLLFATENPDIIRNLFYGDEKSINIAVVPTYENGCGDEEGEIAVDYAEVVVRYSITP